MPRYHSPATSREDMDLIEKLCTKLVREPSAFPMGYTYAGRQFKGLPEGAKSAWRLADANIEELTYTARVPESPLSLRVECFIYRDFPVVEWTAYFTNDGEADSAILQDVRAAELTFEGKDPVVHLNNGDFYSEDGYTERAVALRPGDEVTQAPSEGRACNEAWPYQRLTFCGFGLNIAIGWPAQWESAYRAEDAGVRFRAGQQTVHTFLKPGETLRTPRMCVMAFEGDAVRGMNMWRRWMNAHVTPRAHGAILPPRATASEPGDGEEFTASTEHLELEALDKLRAFGWGNDILWWIDAGWYPCYVEPGVKRWPHTGTWEPDRAKYARDGTGGRQSP